MNKNQLSAEIFCFTVLLSAASVNLKVKRFKKTKQISDYLQSREIKFFAMQCFHLQFHQIASLHLHFFLAGKELQFLLSHSGEKVFEVLRFKEEPRSWFVEDSVQKGIV